MLAVTDSGQCSQVLSVSTANFQLSLKSTLRTGHEGPGGGVLTSALGEVRWSKPRPVRFTPGKHPVPI